MSLCNLCWSGKAVSITHCECVAADLVIQHAMCAYHIVICGMIGSTIFFHSISNNMTWQGCVLNKWNAPCQSILSKTLIPLLMFCSIKLVTEFTVRETPSSVTDPFFATNLINSCGHHHIFFFTSDKCGAFFFAQ